MNAYKRLGSIGRTASDNSQVALCWKKISTSPLTPRCGVCSNYYMTNRRFGKYVRKRREALRKREPRYSVRQVAQRVGLEPSYLSKIERGQQAPPGEQTIVALARDLGEDPDVLLALAGKVSSDLQAIIRKRPQLFADLIRQLKSMPDHAVLRIVREVRDGDW